MGGQILEHLRFGDRARPHAVEVASDLDVGIGFRGFEERLMLGHRIRGAWLSVHENDVSLAAELLHDPVALQLGVEVGIARDVDRLRTIDRRIDRDDEDALVEGVADTGAEARRRARIHHDEIAPLRDLRLQLRELEVDVAVRIGDDQLVLGQSLLRELRRQRPAARRRDWRARNCRGRNCCGRSARAPCGAANWPADRRQVSSSTNSPDNIAGRLSERSLAPRPVARALDFHPRGLAKREA